MNCKCQICRIVELYYQILQKDDNEVRGSAKKWSYDHCFKAIDIIRKRNIHALINWHSKNPLGYCQKLGGKYYDLYE